ncbi:hypothetical protein PR202_gb02867 [Eleusine coracana subsp. coracana]|uniref:Uncharacterized protein n=1 Tax=Eleusine coracana subsp. coracana TaxID=191504 RepID=A0AAV5DZU1_ELECO|nr:hypothetical protein PR202_gb02867 [Eleusine coracana subsp. coracana]
MATLTMQPINPSPGPATQEDQRRVFFPPQLLSGKSSGEDDLGDIDSGWVVLQNSDIVPADLAAAAAGSSPTIPTWARWVLGGVVLTVVPFYKRIRHAEGETVGIVENAVKVVEHVAEVTEKLAANVADQLPEDGSLQKVVEKVEYIAEVVDNDAEKVEAIVEKVCFQFLVLLSIVQYALILS